MPAVPLPTPVIYVHGWLGTHADWAPVQTLLPGWTVDLPGHGASLSLPSGTYSLSGTADALVDALDAAALERPVLVGYSMGGRVAMTAALRHPGRFRALVVESASPGLSSDAERAARHALDDARAAHVERDFAGFLASWYQLPLFASLALEPGRVEATIAERLRGDPGELARALRGLSVAHQPSYWDRLGALPPTLALAGARDEKYVHIVQLMARASTVTARIVSAAGHNVHRERSAAFVDAVVSWFETL
ncbi:MAG: alpha/beta fold hydrolase [Bacteroidota bacterium]